MLTKRIIPCLDVTAGRVVKGTNFVDLKDAGDPVELGKRYDQEGADELVFLDITASSDKRYILRDLVRRTAAEIFIPFTVGGGIQDIQTITDILNAGADKVSINSAAITNLSLIRDASRKFGAQCIVIAIDAKKIVNLQENLIPRAQKVPFVIPSDVKLDERSVWEVYIHGGRIPTGIDAIKWALFNEAQGAGEVLLTSMDRDGTKQGYDLLITKTIAELVHIPVIASGGAGTIAHIREALDVCSAALLASLLHYRELTIGEIKDMLVSQNISIRI